MALPIDGSVYYHGVYWNSYEYVQRHLNRLAFGSEEGNWCQYLARTGLGRYDRALSLNCGTGWVERDLLDAGAASSVVAVEYLDELLALARERSAGYAIEYVQADTNQAEFPPGDYDLVVNHSAAHHLTYIDRVYRALWEVLVATNGAYVAWDYTGPHRNQYGGRAWDAAAAVNARIPEPYRAELSYPNLPMMLREDHVSHLRHLGGAIAYPILTHNDQLWNAPPDARDEIVAMVVAADAAHLAEFPDDSLFTFCIGAPRAVAELDPVVLSRWTSEEEDREDLAARHGGRYYLPTPLEQQLYPPAADMSRAVPADVATRGPIFTAQAFIRAVVLQVPGLHSLLRGVHRRIRFARRE